MKQNSSVILKRRKFAVEQRERQLSRVLRSFEQNKDKLFLKLKQSFENYDFKNWKPENLSLFSYQISYDFFPSKFLSVKLFSLHF